jgi:hypothetical protein
MHELENTQSIDPLVLELQKLMFSQAPEKKACGGKVGMQKGGKLPKSERKLGMKGTVQKMQGGGIPGPMEMFQDPSLYEKYIKHLQLTDPKYAGEATSDIFAKYATQIPEDAIEETDPVRMERVTKPTGKGSASVMKSDVTFNGMPLAGPLSEEQKRPKRIDDAMRRISLIRSAMTLDPQGGGIQQTGPQDIAAQQGIINQQLAAQAVTEQAEAQKAYGEAVGGRSQPQQSTEEKQLQQIYNETYRMIGKENPATAMPYTKEELDAIVVERAGAMGLPVDPSLAMQVQQNQALEAGGVGAQINPDLAQQPGPEEKQTALLQFLIQGGDPAQLDPESSQQLLALITQMITEGTAKSGDDVGRLLFGMAGPPIG